MFSKAFFIRVIKTVDCLVHNRTEDIFLARLFSGETRGIAKAMASSSSLTFCNISLITEDIYLKLATCVHYPKSNLYYQGRLFKMHFQNYAPLSTWKPWHFVVSFIYWIYLLETWSMWSLSKEQSILSRETIQNAFFFRLVLQFETWTFYPLSSTAQSNVGTCMRCSCIGQVQVYIVNIVWLT